MATFLDFSQGQGILVCKIPKNANIHVSRSDRKNEGWKERGEILYAIYLGLINNVVARVIVIANLVSYNKATLVIIHYERKTIYNKVVVLSVTGSNFRHRFLGDGGGTYDLDSNLSTNENNQKPQKN